MGSLEALPPVGPDLSPARAARRWLEAFPEGPQLGLGGGVQGLDGLDGLAVQGLDCLDG